MTEPVLTSTRVPVSREMARYPLAHRDGLQALDAMITASRVWRQVTQPQRRVIDTACRPLLPRLRAGTALRAEDMPMLPVIPSQTAASLRRQCLQVDGRLTVRAVHAWYWTVAFPAAPSVPGGE